MLAKRMVAQQKSVLLLGPRQVGKSTLIRSLRPDFALDLASVSTFREYVTSPERLENELRAVPADVKTVFLDEVQRIPDLLNSVQALIDEQPGRFRFLLSGSSARKLRRGQANLLPGRLIVYQMHPLVAAELGEAFDVDRVLAHGTLPGIYTEMDGATRGELLRSYVDTYLREEIQAEALVRDVGGYARLLDRIAAWSGKIINLHRLSRDAMISYETTRRYLEVLEDTLVAARVPAWSGSDQVAQSAHPKILLFDVGVRNALLRRPLDRPLDDERGLLLEHVVGLELHRRVGALWPEARLSYFRTRSGAEVDYIVTVGRELWAVEVKASTMVARRDLGGLRAFTAKAGSVSRQIVVFLGARRQRIEDVEIIPLLEFLNELPR